MSDKEKGAEKSIPDIMMTIATSYLINNCKNCPFYCISKTCDSVPLNCSWLGLYSHFMNYVPNSEDKEADNDKDKL